jgi:hypothetical protein
MVNLIGTASMAGEVNRYNEPAFAEANLTNHYEQHSRTR